MAAVGKKNTHYESILKSIQQLGQKYSVWRVFADFVEISALAVANSCAVSKDEWEKREANYLETIGRYQPDEQNQLVEMFVELVRALQYEITHRNAPSDILGEMFHELGLHNTYAGQFFSPQSVCDMMGMIAFGDGDNEELRKKGYITLNEPCCGSGAMILGFAKAMLGKKLNYCSQLVVLATDIDLKCVHMCYLQLSLYGIPAVVVHGDTITLEEHSKWFTPVYIAHGWRWRSGIVSNLDLLRVQSSSDGE